MKLFSKLAVILENNSKRKTLEQLRFMTERQLKDCGYSPELLSEGIKAWPWRELSEDFRPLQFSQTLNLETLSTKSLLKDISAENSSSAQKQAA